MSDREHLRSSVSVAAAVWLAALGVLVCPARAGYIGGLAVGVSDRVYALALHGGDLYAAGCFDATWGRVSPLGRVARYGYNGWEPLGEPTAAGEFRCLASYGGELIVGGDFWKVGGVTAASIARWNGTNWSQLGGGIAGGVRVLAPVGTDLFVGGDFDYAGAIRCNGLARWDGIQFHAMGMGRFTAQVRAMVVYHGDLFVGGTALEVPGVVGGGHALLRWDGTTWHTVGGGLEHEEYVVAPAVDLSVATPASVLALAVFEDRLVIGGQFRRAYNGAVAVSADGLMQWDGVQFSPIGGGSLVPTQDGGVDAPSATRSVFALAVHGGILLVGGAFQGVDLPGGGVIYCANLAGWNGTNWIDPDTPGPQGDIPYSMVSLPGAAVLGGRTISMAGIPVGYVVQWARDAVAADPAPSLPATTTALQGASPNPFNPRTSIRFTLGQAGHARLAIHDAGGRAVVVLVDGWRPAGAQAVTWDGTDANAHPVASGVYFVRLDAAGIHAQSRAALVR